MSLLSRKELADFFSTSYFYQNQLIYVIDPISRTYQTDRHFSNLIEYAKFVRQAYFDGQTVVVKGLENYSVPVAKAACELGAGVNAHLYLTKNAKSASFDFHQDDRDVFIQMIYGQKIFELKYELEIVKISVDPSRALHIPQGIFHRAVSLGESAMISFGRENRLEYPVVGGLELIDFGTNQLEI